MKEYKKDLHKKNLTQSHALMSEFSNAFAQQFAIDARYPFEISLLTDDTSPSLMGVYNLLSITNGSYELLVSSNWETSHAPRVVLLGSNGEWQSAVSVYCENSHIVLEYKLSNTDHTGDQFQRIAFEDATMRSNDGSTTYTGIQFVQELVAAADRNMMQFVFDPINHLYGPPLNCYMTVESIIDL